MGRDRDRGAGAFSCRLMGLRGAGQEGYSLARKSGPALVGHRKNPSPGRRDGGRERLHFALRNTKHAFCPPNPKLLTRTLETGFCRASFGT